MKDLESLAIVVSYYLLNEKSHDVHPIIKSFVQLYNNMMSIHEIHVLELQIERMCMILAV